MREGEGTKEERGGERINPKIRVPQPGVSLNLGLPGHSSIL